MSFGDGDLTWALALSVVGLGQRLCMKEGWSPRRLLEEGCGGDRKAVPGAHGAIPLVLPVMGEGDQGDVIGLCLWMSLCCRPGLGFLASGSC